MTTRIKICGITNLADAEKAVELGVDAIGFVLAESPRRIKPEDAYEISKALPPFISRVGVFVNEEIKTIKQVYDYCQLSMVQLHGDESPAFCKKITRYSRTCCHSY